MKYWPFTEASLERDHSMSTALGLDHCCWFLEDCSEGKHNFSISSCKPCRWIHWKIKTKEENQGYNRGRLQLFCSGVHQNKALSEEITLQRGTHHVSYSRETDRFNSDLLLAPSCCASYLWPEAFGNLLSIAKQQVICMFLSREETWCWLSIITVIRIFLTQHHVGV